jgi:hypothetical protein
LEEGSVEEDLAAEDSEEEALVVVEGLEAAAWAAQHKAAAAGSFKLEVEILGSVEWVEVLDKQCPSSNPAGRL